MARRPDPGDPTVVGTCLPAFIGHTFLTGFLFLSPSRLRFCVFGLLGHLPIGTSTLALLLCEKLG